MTRDEFVAEIDKLKQSLWFDDGKTIDYSKTVAVVDVDHIRYLARKEAVETVCDLFKDDMTKQGHWTGINQRGSLYNGFVCSKCAYIYDTRGRVNSCEANYCPNCGAKMNEVITNEQY